MNKLLEEKNATAFGAGGSIGGAVARALPTREPRYSSPGTTRAKLEKICSAGGVAETAEVDALDEREVDTHADAVAAKAGSIDVSFNVISHPRQGPQRDRPRPAPGAGGR